MDEVFVVDRVVTAPGCAQRFIDAYLAGYAEEGSLEHIGFGTMNGTDGKPFKTRAGGITLAMVTALAAFIGLALASGAGIRIGDLLNELFKGDTYGTKAQPIPLDWYGPPISDYPPLYFGGPVNARNPARRQSALKAMLGKPDGNGVIVKAYSPLQREALRDEKGAPMPTRTIGLNAGFIIGTGRVLGPLSQETTQGGGKLGQLIEPYGYSGEDGYELDHVHEIQFGGLSANDRVENLWPLEARKNSSKGSALSKAEVEYPKNNKERVRIPTLKLMQGDPENKERFWFVIRSISPRT